MKEPPTVTGYADYFSDGAGQIVDNIFKPTTEIVLIFSEHRIDIDIVVEYLRSAARLKLLCDSNHGLDSFQGTNVRF
jgi:hypothetical protein